MRKYIDAEKLIAEIDRLGDVLNDPICQRDALGPDWVNGGKKMLKEIRSYIESLQQEQPEVDLKKEMDSYFNEHFSPCVDGTLISERTGMEIDGNDYDDIARHFYELGLNARKEE